MEYNRVREGVCFSNLGSSVEVIRGCGRISHVSWEADKHVVFDTLQIPSGSSQICCGAMHKIADPWLHTCPTPGILSMLLLSHEGLGILDIE